MQYSFPFISLKHFKFIKHKRTFTMPPQSSTSSITISPDLLAKRREKNAIVWAAISEEEREFVKDQDGCGLFVRSAGGDVQAAIEKVHYALNWRKEYKPDLISADEPMISEYISLYPDAIRGQDKEGRPIMIVKVCLHDPKKRTLEQALRFAIYSFERVLSKITTSDGTFAMVVDLDGVGMTHLDLTYTKHILQEILPKCYPGRLGVSYVVRPGLSFSVMWSLIKPFIAARNLEKVKILDGKNTLKKLQEFCAPSELPEELQAPTSA